MYCVLEAIRLLKKLPEELKDVDDPGLVVLKELEPEFYLGCAGILMTATYGRKSKAGNLAYKVIEEMIKQELAEEDAKHKVN